MIPPPKIFLTFLLETEIEKKGFDFPTLLSFQVALEAYKGVAASHSHIIKILF